MTFAYLSQFNWRIFIAVKINSDQKERIYKAMKEKAFKAMFNNSPEAAIQRCSWEKELHWKTLKNIIQLYWNCTSAWMFSCKFAAYFQNSFSQEHLWTAASDSLTFCKISIFEVSAFEKFTSTLLSVYAKNQFLRQLTLHQYLQQRRAKTFS